MEFDIIKKTPLYNALSELGKRIYLPQGVFYWAGRAKKEAEIMGTLGSAFGYEKDFIEGGTSEWVPCYLEDIKNYTKLVDPDYQPAVRPEFITAEKPAFKRHHELQFMASVGTVQAEPGEAKDEFGESDTTGQKGPRYGVSSISVDYAYQLGRKFKAVAGLDFFYDGSAEFLYDDILPQNTTFSDKAFWGWHLGFNYLIERFTFLANMGWYIHKPFEQRGGFYFRAGGRIGLTENLDAHIALKTRNGGIADWIEWGLAYKFKLN